MPRRRPVLAVAPLLAAALACGSDREPTPTYYRDVEPILLTRCTGCHTDGGVAPFALGGYEDARSRAALIADRVEARVMPPWPPSDAGVPLLYSRALTDDQVSTIVRWARGGAPEGSPADRQDVHPQVPSIRPDLAVEMAEPYAPDLALEDDYRCFVVDHGLTQDWMLTGYDIAPATPAVHHVILFLVLESGLDALDALDAADPGYGYTCFGATGVEGSDPITSPVRVLGGWAPGSGASPLPAGTGLQIPAGSRIVMQVHYNTARAAGPDQTRASLQLSDGAGLTPALLVPLLDTSFSVPPGATDYEVEQRATIGSPYPPVTLYGAFPHMHLHGTSISVSLERPSGETMLVDIPRWDFHWQGGYQFVDPVSLSAGDSLRLRCVYDNAGGTSPLTWGEGTEDEMCLAFLYVTFR
jgi:mono/diheme cytochrome c family protein